MLSMLILYESYEMRSMMASARVLSPLQICWYHSLSRNWEQKMVDDAKRLAPSLDGRRCVYHHFEGRLVYVENTLFFMKKYAKHLGYALGPADTLQIKWRLEDAA